MILDDDNQIVIKTEGFTDTIKQLRKHIFQHINKKVNDHKSSRCYPASIRTDTEFKVKHSYGFDTYSYMSYPSKKFWLAPHKKQGEWISRETDKILQKVIEVVSSRNGIFQSIKIECY